MSNIRSMIEEADKLLTNYKATAEKIAEVITDTIFDAIGLKLDWSIGYDDETTIFFEIAGGELCQREHEEKVNKLVIEGKTVRVPLAYILTKIFGAKHVTFDSYVSLTEMDANVVIDKLIELIDEEDRHE